MKKLNDHLFNHEKLYLSILLFLLVFCILGLPFTQWGFRCDDWGNIWHSAVKSWRDIITFFTDGKSLDAFHASSNSWTTTKASFFCGLYRPMSLVYLIPQYLLFSTNPYGYFLITIAIHAFSSALLFNILSLFTQLPIAFLAATFFGFHPSLWTWLGWISAQTYNIQLLVLLLIIFLLMYYLEHKKIWAYFFACCLFLTNVFLHEQIFFLPFWLLFAIPLHEEHTQLHAIPYLQRLIKGTLLTLPFLGITIFYFIVRLYYFPLTSNTATLTFEPTWLSFKTRILERTYDFVTFIADIFGLTALPKNNPLFKACLILIIFFVLLWLFIKSDKKKIVLFLACSIPLFGWPALLMHNQPRYYYMAIPLFMVIVIILLPIQKPSQDTRKFVTFAVIIFTNANAFFLLRDLKKRELLYHPVTKAFVQLATDIRTKNRALCFTALPPETHLFGACAQAIWLLKGDNKNPVFSINELPLENQYQKFNPLYVVWDNNNEQFVIQNRQND